VIISTVDGDGSDGARYIRTLVERRVEGILLAAPELERQTEVGVALNGSVPVVSIHAVPGTRVTLVGSNHVETGLLATRHLTEHGHRSIGTIAGPGSRRVVHSRLLGYEQALGEAGLERDERSIEAGDWQVEGGYAAALRLIRRQPGLTALFVQNDTMAIGALSALHDLGRRVPDDCAVVSCDDIPAARRTIPPLTTVRVPLYETGATAMRLLLERIAAPDVESRRVLLPVSLVTRRSCGCPPTPATTTEVSEIMTGSIDGP
jgi:LacI family transcriptional regulator